MTSEHHPLPAGPPAALGPPPADVENVARERDLGSLITGRRLPNPFVTASGYLGLSVLSAVLICVIAVSGHDLGEFSLLRSILHALSIGLVGLMLSGLAIAVHRLVAGPKSYWVFDHGFVHRRWTTVRALSWAEVQRLAPVIGSRSDDAGKVLAYRLVPSAGKPITVPLTVKKGRDPFMDALMAVLQRHDKPIS